MVSTFISLQVFMKYLDDCTIQSNTFDHMQSAVVPPANRGDIMSVQQEAAEASVNVREEL